MASESVWHGVVSWRGCVWGVNIIWIKWSEGKGHSHATEKVREAWSCGGGKPSYIIVTIHEYRFVTPREYVKARIEFNLQAVGVSKGVPDKEG